MTLEPILEVLDFYGADNRSSAHLSIYAQPDKVNSLLRLNPEEAREYGEEPLQLLEGMHYEYALRNKDLILEEEVGKGVVKTSSNPGLSYCGSITPRLNTGRLGLVVRDHQGVLVGRAAVEIRSRKVGYRDDYRKMLEDITEQSTSLLMNLRSPTTLLAIPDPGNSPETIHQRFAFLRALIGSKQFRDALHRLTTYPHSIWEAEEEAITIGRRFRSNSRMMRQLAKSSVRAPVPDGHPIRKVVRSLPEKISVSRNIQSADTPENRFVKFALKVFSSFLNRMRRKLVQVNRDIDKRLISEILDLEGSLEAALSAEVFRRVSNPSFLPLGSPVLQRKAGYREIYQAWLRFDMAARLVWHGGDDVYGAGQRDIATLFEYWVFFRLLAIVSKVFQLENPPAEDLIEETADGFGLKLKTGKHLAFNGAFLGGARPLRVQFSYNRSFKRNSSRRTSGSWTEGMRPDYTLSLWPAEFTENEAESQELMVHVHFDAKYRVDSITQLFGIESIDLDTEKQEQRQGKYKRADLLKMHSYRDAIRRTQGAYILYPGTATKKWNGYHEILPGLGAFPIRPGNSDTDVEEFIGEIVTHLCNRATNLERQSYHVHEIHEAVPDFEVLQSYSERSIDSIKRHAPPAETSVLVGWCKDDDHLNWIQREGLYNFRMDTRSGSLRLSPSVVAAKYLFLHGEGGQSVPGLFRITSKGPRVFSGEVLKKRGYPRQADGNYYLVFDITPDEDFSDQRWDYSKLPNRPGGRLSAWPYSVTLDVLLSMSI